MKPVFACLVVIASLFATSSFAKDREASVEAAFVTNATTFSGTCTRTIVGYSHESHVPSRFEKKFRNDYSIAGSLSIGEFVLDSEFQGVTKFFGGSPDEYVLIYQVPGDNNWPDDQSFSLDFKSDAELKVSYRRANHKSIFPDVKVWGECTLLRQVF